MRSIKTKLIVIYGTVGIALIIILSAIGITSASQGMGKLAEETMQKKLVTDLEVMKEILRSEYGDMTLENGLLYSNQNNALNENHKFIDFWGDKFDNVATIFAKKDDDFIRITTNIIKDDGKRATGTYLGKDSSAYNDIINAKTYVGQANILGHKYLTIYDPIIDENGETIGILFLGISQTDIQNMMLEENRILLRTLLIAAIVLIIVLELITIIVAIGISKPINRAVDTMKKLADYDLTNDINKKDLKRLDEVGVLTKSIALIQDELKSIIDKMKIISNKTAKSSEHLSLASEESRTVFEEVSKTVEEIAEGATSQAEQTSMGNEKLSKLGMFIEEDREFLSEVTNASNEVTKLVKSGLEVLETLNVKTNESSEDAEIVYKSILKTEDSSKKISQASQLILSIANQTNLLALNAAIEAARAGEHGKGFAVVAEEIRDLSEQSSKSAKAIDEMLEILNVDAKDAVNHMEKSKKVVKEQKENVLKMTKTYKNITKAIEKAENTIINLENSSNHMEKEKNDVSETMESLAAISEENAAATEQTSASIEEQLATVEQISNAANELTKLAKELNESIITFKTN